MCCSSFNIVNFLNSRVPYLFLVGVFEEKAQLLQWLVFFRRFNAIGPLFVHLFNFLAERLTRIFWGSEKQERVGSNLALNHKFFMLPKVEGRPKGPPFADFFRHYATFFRKFLNSIKGYPLGFFEVFGL